MRACLPATIAVLFALTVASPGGTGARQAAPPQTPPPERQPADQQQPAQPTFRVEANFIRVDVYPSLGGMPVMDLRAEDFEVFEDGRLQTVQTFEHVVIRPAGPDSSRREPSTVAESREMAADPRARLFVLFLDTYHVDISGSHQMQRDLVQLLDRIIGEDDLVGVMTPEMSAANVTLARRTLSIEQMLARYWDWGRRESMTRLDPEEEQYEACYPDVDPPCRDRDEGRTWRGVAWEMIQRRREKLTLDALGDLVQYLWGLREERKAILPITHGWRLFRPNPALALRLKCQPLPGVPEVGTGPGGKPVVARDREDRGFTSLYACDAARMRLSQIDNDQQFRDLLDQANRANASFYPIDPRGMPAFDTPIGPRRPLNVIDDARALRDRIASLRTLADNTDGIAVVGSNDLEPGLQRIAADLSSYYLLGYYSTNTKIDGTYRKLTVRVKRPGVNVRARPGYRAATEEEVAAARPAEAGATPEPEVDAVMRAIGSLAALGRPLPFTLRAVHLPAAGGPGQLYIVGELDYGTARDARWKLGGEATIGASVDGASAFSGKVAIDPGSRRFVALMPAGEPLAPGEYLVQVRLRAAEGGLPLADTVRVTVGDTASAALVDPLVYRRGPSTGLAYEPTADLRFRRTEWIRVAVPIDPGATAMFKLLDRTGTVMGVPVATPAVPPAELLAVSGRAGGTAAAAAPGGWAVGQLSLAALAPADYAVEIEIAAGPERSKILAPFRIVP
jgi:VWFA-related protein